MKTVEVVCAVIYDKNNNIFITQRKGDQFDGMWEFPGGKIEYGETNEQALIREIKEELELDIVIENFITTIEYQYPNFYLIMHAYKCNMKNNNIRLNVHKDAKWVSISDLNKIKWVPADIDVVKKI